MAVETGRKLGDPFLREACKEVEQASAPETGALVEDLADTLALWRKTTGYGRASLLRKSELRNASSSCSCDVTVRYQDLQGKRTRFKQRNCEIFRSCSSMKSIIWMAFSASTA